MDPTSITTALGDILTACTDAFAQDGTNPAPGLMFVTHGQPITYGVDQLAIWTPGLRTTKPFPLTRLSAIRTSVIPALDITIELWRACWPLPAVSSASKQLPNATAISTATAFLDNDAATLYGHIADLATHGHLFPSLPTIGKADDVQLQTLAPLAPQGALAGWRWPISVKLAIP